MRYADPCTVRVLARNRRTKGFADARHQHKRGGAFFDEPLDFVGVIFLLRAAFRQDRKFPYRIRRSEEHTSELQSPYVISYAVFCLKKTYKCCGRRAQESSGTPFPSANTATERSR